MSPDGSTFEPVDLTELQDAGVLLAANERFFWPLGLALTWDHGDTGIASNLHVREWKYPDNHVESIELAEDDPVAAERRPRLAAWLDERIARFKFANEASSAKQLAVEVLRAE